MIGSRGSNHGVKNTIRPRIKRTEGLQRANCGNRIQTWALEEARRRLEAEGILPDPDDEEKKQT